MIARVIEVVLTSIIIGTRILHPSRKIARLLHGTSIMGILLMVLCCSFILSSGCQSSRDSGSTVTGRALSYPTDNSIPFIRVLVNGDNALRLQVTDSNGMFSMFHVPKGTYKVRLARFGVELYSQDLVIEQDETTYVVNLPELIPGTQELAGTIEDDNGPVSDAEVWIIYDAGGMAYGMTNEDGQYAIGDLPDGDTTVVMLAEKHMMKVIEDVRIGFEGTNELDAELDIIPDYEGGIVLGNITAEDGENLEDAYVGIFPHDAIPSIFMVAEAETLSVEEGYILADVPAGEYTVICTKSGYALETADVVVEENGTHYVNFDLESEEKIFRDTNISELLGSIDK